MPVNYRLFFLLSITRCCSLILKTIGRAGILKAFFIFLELCPDGYRDLEDKLVTLHCYKKINLTLSWEEARSFCILHDGDLATFHNEKEKEILSAMFDDHWMGYNYDKGKMIN